MIPIPPSHREAIKDKYRIALSKTNDVDMFEALKPIWSRARELGYSEEQVNEIYKEVLNERSTKPEPNAAVPTEELPPAQEKPKETRPEKELSRRVEVSYSTPTGMTESGVRKSGASGGKSIVDGIL